MSARQENKWKRNLAATHTATNDRRRQTEATCMTRNSRSAVATPAPASTRQQTRRWMRANAEGYDTATQLAEAANAALELPPGAMDDETHWVWDEALSTVAIRRIP